MNNSWRPEHTGCKMTRLQGQFWSFTLFDVSLPHKSTALAVVNIHFTWQINYTTKVTITINYDETNYSANTSTT